MSAVALSGLATAGIPALLGSLIGAGAALLSAHLAFRRQLAIEQTKWQREDRSRFHATRREIYAKFLVLASQVHQRAVLRNAAAKHGSEAGRLFAQNQGENREHKGNELMLLLEEISLVGSTAVVKAAGQIAGTALMWRIASHLPTDAELKSAQSDFAKTQRKQFLDAAREELGIEKLEIGGPS